jgi:hypothetical protein
VRSTDNRYCAGKAAHDHILVADTHINFSIERTTGKSWRGRSPYLSYYSLQSPGPSVGAPHSVRTPLESIKGRVHSLEEKVNRSIRFIRPNNSSSFLKQHNTQVDVGYYAPAARTTLNLCVFPVFVHPLIKRSYVSPKLFLN